MNLSWTSCLLIILSGTTCMPRADAADDAEPPKSGITTLANRSVQYTASDQPWLVLKRAEVEAIVVDNRAVEDPALPGGVLNNRIHSNIVLSGGKPILAFYDHRLPWGEKTHLACMDHNFYDAQPSYSFALYGQPKSKFTLDQMREKGFEKNSTVVANSAEIFEDEKSWKLKPAFQKAGQDGTSPGPADLAQILDTTRYGPAAREE